MHIWNKCDLLSLSCYSYTQGPGFILNQINGLTYIGGETRTDEALRITRMEVVGRLGDRPRVENLVILITDGIPYPDSRRDPSVTEAGLLQAVAKMVSVGITDLIDANLLRLFSSPPQEMDKDYYTSPDFETLEQNVLENLLREVCPETVERT